MDDDLPDLVARQNHLGILRYIRAHKLRNPDLVIHHGQKLLFSGSSILFSPIDDFERLAALEQLCLSALDAHDHTLARKCMSEIRKFPEVSQDSMRVRRILGSCLESAGDLEQANEIYDELLKQNPANTFALKRKYCILRAQVGMEMEAKTALNKYVDSNQGDIGGWMEMTKLCFEVGDYKGAIFCLEEVILANPLDASLHCRLGEVHITVGGIENLKLARKHLAQSLELCPADKGNVRALYALISAASTYLEESSGTGRKKDYGEEDFEVAKELVAYGVEKMNHLYNGTPLNAIISKVIQLQENEF